MKTINDVSLLDILPPNLTSDENVKAAAKAIDAELLKVTEASKLLALEYSIDSLPEAWVDHLAFQNRVDFYDTSLDLEVKRKLVKNSRAVKMIKGTKAAVEQLIEIVYGSGEMKEWFEYGGEPGHFKVITDDITITGSQNAQFLRLLNAVKRKSAVFDGIEATVADTMDLYFGGVINIGGTITIR